MKNDANLSAHRFLIIAGTSKAGTRSVFNYLAGHPQICPAEKETRFFLDAYLKGVFAIGGAGLIGYLLRSWLSNVGYSPFTIIPLGGIAFLITATLGFWLLGLDHEDKMAIVALRRRQSDVPVLPARKAPEQRLY
jgi:hypothetical protein